MSEPEITCEKMGCCGVITLNRPEGPQCADLEHGARDRARARPVGSAILRSDPSSSGPARGEAFCAGADIRTSV